MKSKLSPIEELRQERVLLKDEIDRHEKNLKDNLSYVRHNWGSIIMSSIFSSSVNSISNFFNSGSGEGKKASLLDRIIMVLPRIWPVIQPMIIGILTKRITSFLFGNKSKGK